VEVRVLGSSGGASPGCPPTSFLVDGRLSVDAGAVATALTLEEQSRVRDVLLTHSHLDHVRDLPLLLINSDRDGEPLRVHAMQVTLDAIRAHLFNKSIWFEAFSIPSPEAPLLSGRPLPLGRPVDVAGYRVTGYPLRHTVESAGWLVERDGTSVFFAGDTDQEDCLVGPVRDAGDRLHAVFLEASYPDRMADFARLTGHLTPTQLGRAARNVPDGTPILVSHLKPGFEDEIGREIAALGRPWIRPVTAGEIVRIGAA
jgi:Cft2 family RNA processing exonuclease